MSGVELGSRAITFASGLLFGAGLLLSGMTQPSRVLGFLDVFGAWDPTLALVMAGAVTVHFAVYRSVRARAAPLLESKWSLPTRRDIDAKLLLGAVLFGVGWGLAGYCPGPGVVAFASGSPQALLFVGALVAGTLFTIWIERRLAHGLTGDSHAGAYRQSR